MDVAVRHGVVALTWTNCETPSGQERLRLWRGRCLCSWYSPWFLSRDKARSLVSRHCADAWDVVDGSTTLQVSGQKKERGESALGGTSV